MGLMDKVKKILFDDEDTDDLPVRSDKTDKKEKKQEETNDLFEEIEKEAGGVVIHNDIDDDTITEVKVPVEKNDSFIFPVKVDEDDYVAPKESVSDTQQLRLQENELDRTQEIDRLRERNLAKSREDYIKEYTENRRIQKEVMAKRDFSEIPEKKEKGPYKVPPVISPVFGILDKNYDPDTIEETKQQITMTNSGNAQKISERQFGPVSFNDQGIPQPRIINKTVIITASVDSSDSLKEELKKEKEQVKETNAIEDEIINSIINDEIKTHDDIEEAFEDTKEMDTIKKPIIQEEVEEPTLEFETPKKKVEEEDLPVIEDIDEEESDEVITGSPYDDILDEMEPEEELKPTKDINDVIAETAAMEEADITPDAPKNLEDNEKLDDTIETDLYNLIDSMYKDED